MNAAHGPIPVAICDDSAVARGIIGRILEAEPDIRIVLRATNGRALLDGLAQARPEVIVLDIEMPELDGLAALPHILAALPRVRVLMSSSLTTSGADATLRALRLGAADYIAKPSGLGGANARDWGAALVAKIRGLATSRRPAVQAAFPLRAPPAHPPRLVAIGSSTGGPQALLRVVGALGAGFPLPLLIVQHMPPAFTTMLASHLNRLGALPCVEATDGAAVEPGRILLAPGNRHMVAERTRTGLVVRLTDGPPENFCRPAVDPLLRSLAASEARTLAAILTGMGSDGLAGARTLVDSGGGVIAQDEASSVVWGMPGAVAKAGLCHAVLPLDGIAPWLRKSASAMSRLRA